MVEVLNQVKKLTSKYQTPFGLAVWGFTAPGEAKEILVDSEGRLIIGEVVAGEVNVPNIDVPLSTRSSESTLSAIKTQTDKLTFEAATNKLLVKSTRDWSLAASDTPKVLGDQEIAVKQVGAADGRLDICASYVANPSNLDLAVTALRDALLAGTATYPGGLDDIYNRLGARLASADNMLDYLDDIYARLLDVEVDKLLDRTDFLRIGGSDYAATPAYREIKVDADGHLQIDGVTIANPSNLDVALSTRASESKLESVRALLDSLENALASIGTDELRVISV